ncbi:hypothetical protein QBC44DRAFT_388583 [Cladorrhinum sp. PSN332]|nr:hypothetical protein QBC44DRAFT_388583 [Cladorrhinum sp. PSN332]
MALPDYTIAKARPALGGADYFNLSSQEVQEIFGIHPTKFTPIPRQLIVPVLGADPVPSSESRHHISGWLYIVEPQQWFPLLRHGNSVIASKFKSPNSKQRKPIAEAKFNYGCKAAISFQPDGSYYGTRIGLKSSADLAFEYSSSSLTEEQIQTKGLPGGTLLQELVLYPILRCKATRRQPINFTVDGESKQLEWGSKPSDPSDMQGIRVPSSQLGRIVQMEFRPVSNTDRSGEAEAEAVARVLPVPKFGPDGELHVTTLLGHVDSQQEWYIYKAEFEGCSLTIDLAAPQNNVAFPPTSCWASLLEEPDEAFESARVSSGHQDHREVSWGRELVEECII